MKKGTPPAVKGGQGRSDDDVTSSALTIAVGIVIAMAVTAIATISG